MICILYATDEADVRIDAQRRSAIGIDLSGTKIEIIALADTPCSASATLLRLRVPTPVGDYAGILNAVAELVAFTERETGQTGTVGIATPSAISPFLRPLMELLRTVVVTAYGLLGGTAMLAGRVWLGGG